MFYDTSKPIDPGQNEIAESAHFFFPGSLLPTGTETNPSHPHHGISAAAAGAIGVVLTLAVVAACLFAYFFCYRKRPRRVKDDVVNPLPEKHNLKPELDGRIDENVASTIQDLKSQDTQASAMPLLVPSDRNELSASARHELYGYSQGYHGSQRPIAANNSQFPSFELETLSPRDGLLHTIKRKQVGAPV
jgi:hypothetical protein